jgi:hypothetical protein
MEVDLGDVLALEWSPRPPAGNVVAFIAAGLTLRRMHRRAQRGDGDDPPAALDDHDPVIEVPANRTDEAPDYESQASDEAILLQGLQRLNEVSSRLSGRDDGTTASTSGAVDAGIVQHVPQPESPESSSSTCGRVCRFCFVGDDDEDQRAALAPSPRRKRGVPTRDASHDELVAPCLCDGTQKWVHVGCLRQWQNISVANSGARRTRCAVCKAKYKLSKKLTMDDFKNDCGRWFSPHATDRIKLYKKVWWQIATNTVIAAEGIPRLFNPTQVLIMVAATELRIWGSREARGGNKVLRFFQAAARKVTNAHSAALLTWLGILGARSVGDVIGGEGGVLDEIELKLEQELLVERSFDALGLNERRGHGTGGNVSRRKRFFLWIARRTKRTGGFLGVVLRKIAQPCSGVALRVAEPVQSLVSFVERYPQYRVA